MLVVVTPTRLEGSAEELAYRLLQIRHTKDQEQAKGLNILRWMQKSKDTVLFRPGCRCLQLLCETRLGLQQGFDA